MNFKDILNNYIDVLDCTGKELSEYSGLSAATISRYRSGERVPESGTDNLTNLIQGIVHMAADRGIADITADSVTDSFNRTLQSLSSNISVLHTNLDVLLNTLDISGSEFSKYLNYDSSYVSRIRNGKRQPSNPQNFISETAHFIVHRYSTIQQKNLVCRLTGCTMEDIADDSSYMNFISLWLSDGTVNTYDSLSVFLEKLNEFNLDEYIRAIHFDELKVPTVPFQFPGSKSYSGLQEMMNSELDFLKTTVLSKSCEPVTMYSDMPMEEMAKDPEFPKKWMFGMAMMLKKGLHLNQIHNLDRSFEDMMLGLESWIPMYMTGQISPYYLKSAENTTFLHLLKVSGAAALTGEAITGHHADGRYYLTKNKNEVAYYKKRADDLLANAFPLMEIYRNDSNRKLDTFLQSDISTDGNRRTILSSLPLHTLSDDLLKRILKHNKVEDSEAGIIAGYIAEQRTNISRITEHAILTEEIPILTKEEFEQYPISLSLSGIFYEKDILYSYDDYEEHLNLTRRYETEHANYILKNNPLSAFRNIQIRIHEGKWVMVSKNKTPSIHFLIRHPKLRNAFENMIIPVQDRKNGADE